MRLTITAASTISTTRYLCSVTFNYRSMSGNVKHQARLM
jgi:hypothetical protein